MTSRNEPKMGVRNRDIVQVTGHTSGAIANLSRRGKFTRLDDGSYHTEQVDAWIAETIDPSIRIPDGQRGYLFEDDGETAIAENQESAPASPNRLRAKVGLLKRRVEFLAYQLNSERAKVVLAGEIADYFATTRDIICTGVRAACTGVGAEVVAINTHYRERFDGTYPSRFDPDGIDNDYRIHRALVDQMQRAFNEMAEPLGESARAFSPPDGVSVGDVAGTLVEQYEQLREIDDDLSALRKEHQLDVATRALVPRRVPKEYRAAFAVLRRSVEGVGNTITLSLVDVMDAADVERILTREVDRLLDHFERQAGDVLAGLLGGESAVASGFRMNEVSQNGTGYR